MKISLKYSFVIVLLCVCMGLSPNDKLHAQNTNNVVLHVDKSFYVTGEVIWYKLYLPVFLKDQAFTVKVDVKDQMGNSVDYFFLKTEGKTYVDGYYKVPFSISSGHHRFVFSAVKAGDKSTLELGSTNIPFYNDLNSSEISNSSVSEINAGGMPPPLPGGLQVRVDLDRDQVKNRQAVSGKVMVTDASGNPVNGNVSIAVRDQSLTGPAVLNQNTLVVNGVLEEGMKFGNTVYTRAQITDDAGQPRVANVLGAYNSTDEQMLYTRSNSSGAVHLELPDFYGSRPIHFLGYEKEKADINIAQVDDIDGAKPPALTYTKGIIDYLNLSRQRKKIYQLYTALEFNLEPEAVQAAVANLPEGLTFRIKDYTRFDNLAIFFKEVLAPLKFKQERDGSYTAQMYNPKGKRFDLDFTGRPLFIVDGKLTRDGNFIAGLDIDKVEDVVLYSDPQVLRKYFKVLGGSGVAVINTRIKDLKVPPGDEDDIVMVNGLQRAAAFPVFNAEQLDGGEFQPFFRPQLYWNPELSLSNGQSTFSFEQSDDISSFLIEVVVQTEDGKYGYAQQTYQVVW